MRQLYLGSMTFADMLGSQRLRTVDKKDLPSPSMSGAWTLDRFGEALNPQKLGLKGSLEALPDSAGQDPRLSHEKVANHLRGLSCFNFPKILRYIAREGLGLMQVDCINSHLQHMVNMIGAADIKDYPELLEAVLDRSGVFAKLQKDLNKSRDVVKKLILALTYGGGLCNQLEAIGFRGEPPEWLVRYQKCIRRLANNKAKEYPEKIAILKELGKEDAPISLLSFLAADLQRATLDKIEADVPEPVVSYERDCLVYLPDNLSKWKSLVQSLSSVPITIEEFPDGCAIRELLQAKYPFMDWTVTSRIKYDDFRRARESCLRSLQPKLDTNGEPKCQTPDNVTDFGTVIAVRLEPFIICGRKATMEYYDKTLSPAGFGMWRTFEDRAHALKSVVRDMLLQEFKKMSYKYEDGKLFFTTVGEPPRACKRPGFYKSVAEDVSLTLVRSAPSAFLDNEHTRRFLQDVDGRVYDFQTDVFVVNQPGIRVGRHVPWSFVPNAPGSKHKLGEPEDVWDAPVAVKEQMRSLLQGIFNFWLAGDGPKDKSLYADPFGISLAQAFSTYVATCEHCHMWKLYMPMFKNDVDEVLWRVMHQCADICAWRRRTEFSYAHGPGNSGKDTAHILAIRFFGDRACNGLSFMVPKDYFVGRSKRADLDTTLDSCKHMRYMGNNEVPQHGFFDTDSIKPMVEMRGTGIVSRTIYEKPERWLPMGGLHLTSNHPLILSEAQCADTGLERRLNYYSMLHRFPDDAVKDIKDEIETGKYNGEMLWIAREFYTYFNKCPPGFTRLHPRPPRIQRETEAVLNPDRLEELRAWIEEKCEPVAKYSLGTTASMIREAIKEDLSYDDKKVKELLQEAGVKDTSNGQQRVLTYGFPGHNLRRAQAMKLK